MPDPDRDLGGAPGPDASGLPDASEPDFGEFDAGAAPDLSRPDAGFADPAAIDIGRQNIDGLETFVHVRGVLDPASPPIVLIGEGPAVGFDYMIDPFEFLLGSGGADNPERLLIFMDIAGQGRSEEGSTQRPEVSVENGITSLVNALEHFRDAYDERAPDIVAQGYGAMVAAVVGSRRPELVNRLVLITPYPTNLPQRGRWLTDIQVTLSSGDRTFISSLTSDPACRNDPEDCARDIFKTYAKHWVCFETRDAFDELTFDFVNPVGAFSIEGALRRPPPDGFSVVADVEALRAPTTVIVGACDYLPETTIGTYTSSTGAARVELPDAGHWPMVESPAAFQQAVFDGLYGPIP